MNGINSYGRRRDLSWTLAILVTLLLVAFFGWLAVRDTDDAGTVTPVTAPTTAAPPAVPSTLAPVTLAPTTVATTTTVPAPATLAPTTVPPSTIPEPVTDTTAAPTTTAPPPAAPATTAPASGSTTTVVVSQDVAADPASGLSYPTLSDGSPVPILGLYDGDEVRLSGMIPSQAAKDRLIGLAIANSRSPEPVLIDELVINPDVPIRIGVRVIDTGSSRFDDGSSVVTPLLAAEYDRFIPVLEALPEVDILIVGHADQRGDAATNFAISRDRAAAVNDYIVSQGISPLRIASRAVGEEDLLTTGTDRASLALNRRTEIIFYGLLVE